MGVELAGKKHRFGAWRILMKKSKRRKKILEGKREKFS